MNRQAQDLKIGQVKEDIENAFEKFNAPIEVEIYEEDEKKSGENIN
jgi:hypothetical protein